MAGEKNTSTLTLTHTHTHTCSHKTKSSDAFAQQLMLQNTQGIRMSCDLVRSAPTSPSMLHLLAQSHELDAPNTWQY